MKKRLLAVLLALAALLLSGCGGENGGTRKTGGAPSVNDVMRQKTGETKAAGETETRPEQTENAALEEAPALTREEAAAVETPEMTLEEELAAQTPSPQFQKALEAATSGGNENAGGNGDESGIVSSAHPSALDPLATDYLEISPVTIPPVIDWDLSRLSGTVAYAQMYNILVSPEEYVGKAVKLRGVYNELDNPIGDGSKFHFVLVYDNAACCELAIEILTTTRANRLSYPPPGSLIEVTGIFDICYDQEQQFSSLRVNDLTVVLEAGPDGMPVVGAQQ